MGTRTLFATRSWWRCARRRNPSRGLALIALAIVTLLIAMVLLALLPERAGGITCDTLAGSFKIRCR